MRVRVPKPNRTFLEMDELALLLDAAGIQDRLPEDMRLPQEPGLMTSRVAHLLTQGYRPAQIARRLGCARSTVSFHLRLLGVEAGRGYAGLLSPNAYSWPVEAADADGTAHTIASATRATTKPPRDAPNPTPHEPR
jgi:hypothetical protein